MRSRGGLAGGLVVGLVLVVALLVVFLQPPGAEPAGPAQPAGPARTATMDPDSGLRVVALATLPAEARETVGLIDRGGPFPYGKDGAVFGKPGAAAADPGERLLP